MTQENVVQLATRVTPEMFAVVEILVAKEQRSKADWLRELVEDRVDEFRKEVGVAL